MKSEPIRAAIEAGDYSLAASLWQEWMADLQTTGDVADCRLAAELVEWSRDILLCARAHTVDQLKTLRVAGAYGSALSHGDVEISHGASRSL